MIKKIPHTEFVIVCDGKNCKNETAGSFNCAEEIAEAKRTGWKFTPRCFEQDIALCPDCVTAQEGEGK